MTIVETTRQTHPVLKALASQLDEFYDHVKPWRPEYQDELKAALEMGAEAQAKLKQTVDESTSVIFENENKALVIT